MTTVKLALPTHLAGYLLMNDLEGVTGYDLAALRAALKYEFGPDAARWDCIDVDDDSLSYGRFGGEYCELADYTFQLAR